MMFKINKPFMKRTSQLFIFSFFFSLLFVSLSCKKDPETPKPVVTAPEAAFTYTVDKLEATFTSTSTNNPTELSWDFGDGKSGTGEKVTHVYDSVGNYTVKLTAKNSAGENFTSQQILFKEQIIEIKTSFGTMIMWLYNETPKHKANFLKLASENFFDGVTFHRIVKDFVIQGGDPLSKDDDPDNDGTGGPGYTIPAEIRSDLKHIYGAVGAARTQNPAKASSGSQFYIVVNKAGTPNLNTQYTVFGQIIQGMDVAMTIADQPNSGSPSNRPDNNIVMDVNILQKTRAEILADYNYTVK
ncbi:MAG: PKD domain-containing protein [Sphingobacteriales bacterium]|nr:MAG: PKD domain-containing protein [Sphingobacteriales bacterium]